MGGFTGGFGVSAKDRLCVPTKRAYPAGSRFGDITDVSAVKQFFGKHSRMYAGGPNGTPRLR
jgi:hypothetical protein